MPKLKEMGISVENVNARDYVGQAQAAERLGFHSFWVPEDCVFPGAFSSCAAIAAVTSRIKIGTDVINPYTRHPVLIALELAALDQLSGGRAILGLGASLRLWIEEQMSLAQLFNRKISRAGRGKKKAADVMKGDKPCHRFPVAPLGVAVLAALNPDVEQSGNRSIEPFHPFTDRRRVAAGGNGGKARSGSRTERAVLMGIVVPAFHAR